jgi:hypothetical protein
MNHVVKLSKIAREAPVTLGVGAIALLVGCATLGEARKPEALVCPQCRMVEVRSPLSGLTDAIPAFRTGSGAIYHGTTYEHRCEGCQGVLTPFFREGKFQHQCSICKETPFTCPVVHPKTARL